MRPPARDGEGAATGRERHMAFAPRAFSLNTEGAAGAGVAEPRQNAEGPKERGVRNSPTPFRRLPQRARRLRPARRAKAVGATPSTPPFSIHCSLLTSPRTAALPTCSTAALPPAIPTPPTVTFARAPRPHPRPAPRKMSENSSAANPRPRTHLRARSERSTRSCTAGARANPSSHPTDRGPPAPPPSPLPSGHLTRCLDAPCLGAFPALDSVSPLAIWPVVFGPLEPSHAHDHHPRTLAHRLRPLGRALPLA